MKQQIALLLGAPTSDSKAERDAGAGPATSGLLPVSRTPSLGVMMEPEAARDLDVHENQLRKWVKEFTSDPAQAFPGQGQMKPEQLEIERLRREVAKLEAERDILK